MRLSISFLEKRRGILRNIPADGKNSLQSGEKRATLSPWQSRTARVQAFSEVAVPEGRGVVRRTNSVNVTYTRQCVVRIPLPHTG